MTQTMQRALKTLSVTISMHLRRRIKTYTLNHHP